MNKQNKKRGPSRRKEKDLQRQRLLILFLLLAVCYESGKPGILNPSKWRRAGRASERASPLFPVKIDRKAPYQVKAITSLFLYVRTPLFQSGAALPPANPAISEPHPIQWRTSQFLRFPAPLAYYYSILKILLFKKTNKLGFQTLARLNRLNDLFLR